MKKYNPFNPNSVVSTNLFAGRTDYVLRISKKVEMLGLATENAKQRAENKVKATGNKIGFIRSARMGVFQITPVNSTEVSDYGVNDATSLEKKVTAVVNAGFSIQ